MQGQYGCLTGLCHKIFCFRFFSCIIFPQAPENNIRVNAWRYSQVEVHCTTDINDPNFATSTAAVVDTVANLSTIPVANCHWYQ
jgi:hypothetical protein